MGPFLTSGACEETSWWLHEHLYPVSCSCLQVVDFTNVHTMTPENYKSTGMAVMVLFVSLTFDEFTSLMVLAVD